MKKNKSKIKLFIKPLFAALFAVTAFGCGEDVITPQDNLNFSVVSSGDSIGDNNDVLILEEVKLLIKDIKLNVASSNPDSVNFKVGPYVLYLDLSSEINLVGTAYIPPGTYDKVRFMVHKPRGNETPPDPEFTDESGRYSVIVRGTFNTIPFIYKSDKSAHQKLTFPGSLQVSPSGKTNITLMVRPYIWFIKNGAYLDPMNPDNENDIDNNIKDNINNNFKIFTDDNRNGEPD